VKRTVQDTPSTEAIRDAIEDPRLRGIVDAALHEIGSARPAAHFLPRLRARLEQVDRGPGPWLVRTALAGVAIAAVVIAGRFSSEPVVAPAGPARPQAAWQPGPDAQTPPPAALVAKKGSATHRPRERARRSPGAHEVVVPAGQRQAVGRLFDALRAGRPEVISMLLTMHGQGAAVETAPELTIAPLQVEPVAVAPLPDR
jgi:hypothetical protein